MAMKTSDKAIQDHLPGLTLRQVVPDLHEHGVRSGYQ